MGMPAATANSSVTGIDIHFVLVPTPGGPVPTPLPHAFNGTIDGGLVNNVKINGQPAAVVGSTATNEPAHFRRHRGPDFRSRQRISGSVFIGSATVRIGGKAAARNGDPVTTCNDPADLPAGTIIAVGTVLIG